MAIVSKKTKLHTYSWESTSKDWGGTFEAENPLEMTVKIKNKGALPSQIRLKRVEFITDSNFLAVDEPELEVAYISEVLANPGDSVVLSAKMTTKEGKPFAGKGSLKFHFLVERPYPQTAQVTVVHWEWAVDFSK